MSACSKETLHDTTSEPILEPNSAVTQLPAAYGFGFSNYTPFQVTAFFVGRTSFSGWGYLHKHKCMRSSWLRTHSFPIELTRLRVTLTPHGFAVSECKHQCTAHEVLHVSEGTFCTMISWWEHIQKWSKDVQNTTWIWWFYGEHNILSSLQLLSLSLPPSLHLQLTSSSHVFRYMLFTTSIQFTLLYICLLPGCAAYWIICHT